MHLNQVTFGGALDILKKLFNRGRLPEVEVDIYGNRIKPGKNKPGKKVTNEHVVPQALGGPDDVHNIALAAATSNSDRGTDNIGEYVSDKQFDEYADQFRDIKLDDFDGNDYVEGLRKFFEFAKNL